MLEWFAPPLLIAAAAMLPKRNMSDGKKIEEIFKNARICVRDGESYSYPKLYKTIKQEHKTTYLYSLPLGIPSEIFNKIKPVFEDGLNKDIEIEYEGLLKISVYNEKLPPKWTFDNNILAHKWEVPIGKNHEGILYHDFDKYPHMLVGGVTRFGKTVFIKEIFYSLAMSNPDDVDFCILDLKGGMEFSKYDSLPNVKSIACDLFESTETLAYILDDIKKRQKYMKNNGYTNIVDTHIKKRTFIIVDEGAELSPDIIADRNLKKYARFCQGALSEIARIGGGLGYRLIFCTQYPTREAVPMQVKMNIVARLSFIAASQIGSRVILDDNGAEDLPSLPGRAIYKIEKNRIIQVPYINDEFMLENLSGVITQKQNNIKQ